MLESELFFNNQWLTTEISLKGGFILLIGITIVSIIYGIIYLISSYKKS